MSAPTRYQELVDSWKFRLSGEAGRWKRLRNRYRGMSCFVIGNGPSLKKQDITQLIGLPTVVTNWFALHEQCAELRPTFYCLCSHEFFGTGSSAPQWDKNVRFNQPLHDLLTERAGEAIKVLPFFFREGVCASRLFRDEEVMYLLFHPPVREIFTDGRMNLQLHRQRLMSGQNVILDFCLPVVHYLGFEDIYLIGCDCDYGTQSPDDPRNYFYDSKHHRSEAPSYEWLQQSWGKDGPVLRSYAVANRIFAESNRSIYNATEGGKLEVFPKLSFGEAVARVRAANHAFDPNRKQ